MMTRAHPSLWVAAAALAFSTAGEAQEARPTAADMISDIAAGTISAEAAVEAALARLEAWAVLNGLAHSNDMAALAAGRAVDAGSTTGPLAGLPIVVKDNIRVEGLPNAAGTPGLMEAIADSHAPVLQRLVDAGAIVIATTNMHELAFGISGWNPTYQTGPEPGVRNPYDTARFAAGSSSGTGALVGAGVVAAGFGTDTGGSVRLPAAINGVSGLRPSMGRYPADGIVPISSTRDTAGVIAASVADIALLDAVITGGDAVEAAPLDGVRLGLGPGFTGNLGPDVQAVWDDVLAELEAAGVVLVEVDDTAIFDLNNQISFPIALMEAGPDLQAYFDTYMPGMSVETMAASIASPDVQGTYAGLVIPGKLPAPDGSLVDGAPIYAAAMAEGRPALIEAYAALFAGNDIDALLFPTAPLVAAMASAEASSVETFFAFIRNTDPGSNAGLPGLSIAAGLGPDTGLPVGIELDGPAGSDTRLLALGLAIEALLGTTPLPPPPGE